MSFFYSPENSVDCGSSTRRSLLNSFGVCCVLTVTCLLPVVQADDTEIFFPELTGGTESLPNVLFVLDNSGSMRGTKMADMKTAVNAIIDSVSEVNIGMMNFTNPEQGGRLVYPVTNVDEPGARAAMKTVVQAMRANTWTPIVRSYYEAAMALTGGPIEFGSANYTSPMIGECQSSHIVVLSDGAATRGRNTDAIKNLAGVTSCENPDVDEACGVELARFLEREDQMSSLDSVQNITTYTIGFNTRSSFLSDLATEGGGSYHEAETASELTDVFMNILGSVSDTETTFVAPGRSVSQSSRLTVGNDLYFPLFKPQPRAAWTGNLKRYELGLSGGAIKILDQNQREAVDPATGFFKESAQSLWSDLVDGKEVGLGGLAGELAKQPLEGANRRKIFTYLGDVNAGPVTLERRDSDYRDEVHLLNDGITAGLFPLAARNEVLRWARGYDERNENNASNTTGIRPHVGDPLHAAPAIVNYSTGKVVYLGTNEGFLHAIEASSGKELFSFVPKELLSNLSTFYVNAPGTEHIYGLDGHLTVWHDDQGPIKNGIVDGSEKVYLYVGMRRGGRHYYAFDVTDPERPKFVWQAEGGTGDFTQLGQTWSKPIKTRIRFKGDVRDVLIFGGGYHPDQDKELGPTRRNDDYGNTVYIVDAVTGAKLWQPEPVGKWADMTFSIPSDIKVLDTDSNGLADRMYVGDMGGQVWRFDIKSSHNTADSVADLVDGGVMANLGGGTDTDSIRFYNEPDVAMINLEGQRFLSVSIGSGWRAHPLNEQINDRFYMLRDNSPLSAPAGYGRLNGSSYRALTDQDLVDVTNRGGETLNNIPYGWFLQMEDSGEKILGKSITINNQLIFSTYVPGSAPNACEPASGTSYAYVVKIANGDPVLIGGLAATDPDEIEEFDKDNRRKPLNLDGIAPPAIAIIAPNGSNVDSTILIGSEELKGIDFSRLTRRTYWVDKHRGPQTPAEIAAE